MAINVGKRFEQNFAKSVPPDVFIHRLHDPPQAWGNQSTTRFSWDNPCDYFMYSRNTLFCLELKSMGTKSCSFELVKGTNKSANIHYHQIESLTKFSEFEGVYAGFLFNFRNDDADVEVTYWQDIKDFNRMTSEIGKKSFNVVDLLKYSPIKIDSEKKKVNYKYDVAKFISNVKDK